jgi:hypothetical protein
MLDQPKKCGVFAVGAFFALSRGACGSSINATNCGLNCGVDDVNNDHVIDNLDVLAIRYNVASGRILLVVSFGAG